MSRLRAAAAATLPPWLAARAAVAAGIVLATVSADQLAVRHPATLHDKLLAWDADLYRRIADDGYRAVPQGFRFFPLFPMLTRGLGWIVGTPAAAVLLANLCAFAAGVALYELVVRETGSAPTSRMATWLLLASPASAPMVMGYAETLGILAAILGFLAARSGRWGWAALAGAVVGGTWSIGALFCIPMAVEAWRGPGSKAWRALCAAAPALATAAYLAWVQWETRDWYGQVFRVQSTIYKRELREPITRLLKAANDLAAGHHPEGVVFPWAVLTIVLVVVALRKLPLSYGLWSAAVLLVAVSARNIDSTERYTMRGFPIVIAAALLLRRERDQWLAVSLSLAGLVVYATAMMVGARVP